MKTERSTKYKAIVAFVLMGFMVWSCAEDPNETGLGILPVGDLISVNRVVEQASIRAYTLADSLQRTDEPDYNILGTYNDPVFGKTRAGFAVQYRILDYPKFVGKSATLDSLVLYLRFKTFVGDTVTEQTFNVYELNSGLDLYSKYYQDIDLPGMSKPTKLAEYKMTPKMKFDTIVKYTSTGIKYYDTLYQVVPIRLDNALGNRFLQADSLDMNSTDAFLKFFKGLYIEAQDLPQGGALLQIGGTSLKLSYKHTAAKDSVYSFYETDNSARVNKFSHDYSSTAFVSELGQENPADTLIYLQTMGGLAANIFIPSLDSWKDSINVALSENKKLAINKAEIVFHVDTLLSDLKDLITPGQLLLTYLDQNGESVVLSDYSLSPAYFGGYLNRSDATYRFNITNHLQDIIEHKKINNKEIENNGFRLTTAFRNTLARRVVLKGSKSKVGIRFEVVYSKLK